MANPTNALFCLTPVSADGHSPTRTPLPLWKRVTARFESCLPAITVVLQAIFAHRVSQGDRLIFEAASARCNGSYDLASAALTSPTSHPTIAGCERAFFEAQFSAALSPWDGPSQPFACRGIPRITVRAYLSRLFSMSYTVSNAVYLMMVMLLDRARMQHPGLFLRSTNVHRLVLAAFVVATKSLEEEYIPNADFAYVGGVPLRELNRLEAAFLALIGWRTQFSQEEFGAFEKSVVIEALGTAEGMSVFQVLQDHNVAGLDAAVHNTRTWALPPTESLSPFEGAVAWRPEVRTSATAARLRQMYGPGAAAGAVAGIAAAIARFNFPEVPTHAPGAALQLRRRIGVAAYAHRPFEHARLLKLLVIINGTSNDTTIPSMVPVLVGGLPTVHLSANARVFAGIGGDEQCTAKVSTNSLMNYTERFERLFRPPPGFDGR